MSRLLAGYRSLLKSRPIITNTVTFASFYTAAELSQQTYNKYYTDKKPPYDFASMARIAAVGSGLYAPSLFFWYRFLDRRFAGTALKSVLAKLFSDQIFASPALLAAFYTLMGVVERRENIFEEFETKYVKTLIVNQAFWFPVQAVNFSLIPPYLRVVYVASCSFIWINILCFIKRQAVETDPLEEVPQDGQILAKGNSIEEVPSDGKILAEANSE